MKANLSILHQQILLGLVLGGCRSEPIKLTDDTNAPVDETGIVSRSCDEHPELTIDEGLDAEGATRLVCQETELDDSCPDASEINGEALVQGVMGSDPVDGGCSTWTGAVTCGPEVVEFDRCCYVVDVRIDWCDIGRPFSVAGEARRSAPRRGDGWAEEMVLRLDLSDALRADLADHWTRMALAEHASVAAFARFQLQLLALGAPPELCAAATRAMGDEIRHARDSFTVASAFHGHPVEPGPLNPEGALTSADPLLDTFVEGCLGETIAAAQAVATAQACTEPKIRALLETIAEDETRHAALAWRFARWMLNEQPEAQARLQAVMGAFTLGPAPKATPDAPTLRHYGRLSDQEMFAVAQQTLNEVIRPAAAQLFS